MKVEKKLHENFTKSKSNELLQNELHTWMTLVLNLLNFLEIRPAESQYNYYITIYRIF